MCKTKIVKFLRETFCKHNYKPLSVKTAGWGYYCIGHECIKCGKFKER